MVVVRYKYPLPNYNGRYLLTEKELVELLDKAYNNGLKDGMSVNDTRTTTFTASSSDRQHRQFPFGDQ